MGPTRVRGDRLDANWHGWKAGWTIPWPSSIYSVVLAGAGIRPGIVHGRSDNRAAYPVEGAVSPQDLVTTIYHCLGIGTDTELSDALGRPLQLCQGTPIQGVLA